MKKLVEEADKKKAIKTLLKNGFFSGIGWAFGVTIGFATVSTILVILLKSAGGLPFIGNIIASIVQSTLDNLTKNTPVFN